jgi:galactose-1-phosphate uridylyltransferase
MQIKIIVTPVRPQNVWQDSITYLHQIVDWKGTIMFSSENKQKTESQLELILNKTK